VPEFVVYVDKQPEVRIEDGVVHIIDKSGQGTIHRVVPIHIYMAQIETSRRLLNEWQAGQAGRVRPFVGKKPPRAHD
jgi:hypothetical protein